MKKLNVAAGVARTYVDYAQRCGADRAALLNGCGLSEHAIAD